MGKKILLADDSITIQKVIELTFSDEDFEVVTVGNGRLALEKLPEVRPDIVLCDIIMPEKDGYEVCQHIKSHPQLAKTPVILMSGVVNRAVAEKAFAVKADELLRKPFQPQDLITRVKHLLKPNGHPAPNPATAASAAAALTSIFSAASAAQQQMRSTPVPISSARPTTSTVAPPNPIQPPSPSTPAPPIQMPPPAARTQGSGDMAKLKIEILRLEGLVKKLQSELLAEREYSRALEEHLKTLQESE